MEQFLLIAAGLGMSFVVGVVTGWYMRLGFEMSRRDEKDFGF